MSRNLSKYRRKLRDARWALIGNIRRLRRCIEQYEEFIGDDPKRCAELREMLAAIDKYGDALGGRSTEQEKETVWDEIQPQDGTATPTFVPEPDPLSVRWRDER